MIRQRLTRLSPLGALIALCCMLLCGCDEQGGLDPRERASMEQIFVEARKLDDAGRYHEALVRYETILGRHPEFVSTRLNAAMAAYDSGQYEKAKEHFEVMHKFGPGDWFVIRKLIQCNERLGNKDVVEKYRAKLEALRQQKDGSVVLKRYQGLTRDYIPIGSMHLIGYEFFEPKKHGRLWLFKLEDRTRGPVSTFLLESTPYFNNDGKRLFCLTEANRGWLRVWHLGVEGRDYAWTRDCVLDCLHGKLQPLVTRPLPPEYQLLTIPDAPPVTAPDDAAGSKTKKANE